MALRTEAFSRYRADAFSIFSGPKSRLCFPEVGLRNHWNVNRRLGPFFFRDRAPITSFVENAITAHKVPVSILEIGPGKGALARTLQEKYGDAIAAYYAIDRDRSVAGSFVLVPTPDSVPENIDLVIAAEVIEHMTADEFFSSLLQKLQGKLTPDASLVISTPNPVAPGGIGRDFTHTQRYPWYDLYALVRLLFTDVEVYRMHYVFSYRRLLSLFPRIVLCGLMELEWCDQLICVGKNPRRGYA